MAGWLGTPVAHPRRFVPDLTFGIREDDVQRLVHELRDTRGADLVVVLSHNGITADLKLAARVAGIDVVLGGHTHDALPAPIEVGRTLVVNSGSHGKFLSRLDLDVRGRRVAGCRYRLLPVLSRDLPEDPEMARLIAEVRAPHEAKLGEALAVSESLLWRRGNFNGTFDEVILDALLERADAEVAFSPGFRWGVTVVPGQTITVEDVYTHTALTYANTWARAMTGAEIQGVMEDVADNLFHRDPYYRQGGDMVRLGGLTYRAQSTRRRPPLPKRPWPFRGCERRGRHLRRCIWIWARRRCERSRWRRMRGPVRGERLSGGRLPVPQQLQWDVYRGRRRGNAAHEPIVDGRRRRRFQQ